MHPTLRARIGATALLAIALVPAGMSAPASAAVVAPCQVVNTSTAVSYKNLQTAIAAAKAKVTLTVTGTCVGTFSITRGLTIQKGAAAAILQGAGDRVLNVASTAPVTLVGLVIQGGTATGCADLAGLRCGAGIRNAAPLTLRTVTVTGNAIDGATSGDAVTGAGIFNAAGARLTITDSTISANRLSGARASGAGIANRGRLTIITSRVRGNSATSALPGTGTATGGGIASTGETATVSLDGVTVSGNTVTAAGAQGGGIAIADGDLTATRSILVANRANGDGGLGGGLYWDSVTGVSLLTDSTISGNVAGARGGGVASTVAGGLFVQAVTVTDNEAPGVGGFDGPATVSGSIIAGNRALLDGSSDDCAIQAPSVDGGDNLIGDGRGCTSFDDGVNGTQVGTHADPLDAKLAALAANGGPTRTHALLAGSPAIDAAGADPCVTDRDQRSTERPQGGACDAGAFERVP